MKQRGKGLGFTLIELMIVVAIMSILAAVAIPSFIKYLRRARESESKEILAKIYKNLKDYYAQVHVDSRHTSFSNAFPINGTCDQAGYPANNLRHGNNYMVATDAFAATCWTRIHFKVTENLYYDYHYATDGLGDPGDHTWAWGIGDLDIDNTPVYWYVNASIQTDGRFAGGKMATKATSVNGDRDAEAY